MKRLAAGNCGFVHTAKGNSSLASRDSKIEPKDVVHSAIENVEHRQTQLIASIKSKREYVLLYDIRWKLDTAPALLQNAAVYRAIFRLR